VTTTSDNATSRADVERGTAIGRYIVLSRLGQGGMGTVYSALDPDLDRRVALKLLSLSDGYGATDMGREARILAKLAHPNVASVFDVGIADQGLYIAMELVDGGDLTAWLEQESRDARRILDVFLDAGRGLAAAHDKGLVHRDFKPSNVLIGSDQRVRVADFGLARLVADDEPSLLPGDTMRGLAAASGTEGGGTPGFIAPEVLLGDSPDAGSDQYSFCVSLTWCLTGSMPDALPDVEAALGELPLTRASRRAIVRGLSPHPDDRFESMDALLEALAVRPRTRLRLAVAVGLGLVGGGGLAVSVLGSSGAADRCAEGREALATIWSDDDGQALRMALAGADTPHAEQTAERVVQRLDAHAQVWIEAQASLCGQPPGDPEIEGRLRCLDDRLLELAAMESVLGQPDGASADQASQAVAGLRSPQFCTDPDWRPPPAVLEPPPSIAADVAELQPKLKLGAAYEVTGQFERALEQLAEVSEAAERLGHAPMQAEAGCYVGLAELELGRYDDATVTLRRAFSVALEAGHDEMMVQAASLLVSATSNRRAELDQAMLWNELAGAAVARIGTDSESAATHWQAQGVLAYRQGEYDWSREALERALTLYREHLPPDHPSIPAAISLLAAVDGAQRRYVDAEAKAREVLALRSSVLGDRHPDLMVDEVTLASALTPQGKPDEAIEHLERALELGLANFDPEHPRRLGVQNNLAAAFNRKGEHARARDLYAEILRVRLRDMGREDPATGLAHHNLATTLYRVGTPDEALEHHAEAVSIFETVYDPRHDRVALALNSQAATLEMMGRCDEAAAAIDRAWAIVEDRESDANTPHPMAAFVANTRAAIRLCLDDPTGALASARRAVEVGESSPGESQASLSRFLVTLARAQLRAGEPDAARRSAERALPLLDDTPSLSRARAELVLARVAHAEGNSAEAQRLAEEARTHLPTTSPRSGAVAREIDRWMGDTGLVEPR